MSAIEIKKDKRTIIISSLGCLGLVAGFLYFNPISNWGNTRLTLFRFIDLGSAEWLNWISLVFLTLAPIFVIITYFLNSYAIYSDNEYIVIPRTKIKLSDIKGVKAGENYIHFVYLKNSKVATTMAWNGMMNAKDKKRVNEIVEEIKERAVAYGASLEL